MGHFHHDNRYKNTRLKKAQSGMRANISYVWKHAATFAATIFHHTRVDIIIYLYKRKAV